MSSPLILSICSYVLFLNQEQNQESWLSIVLISINLLSKKKSYKNKDFFTQVVSYKEICFSIFLFANQLLKVSIFQFYNITIFFWSFIFHRFIATIIPFSKTYDWLIEHTNILLLTGWILGCLFGSLWMPYTMIELIQFSNNQSYFDCTFKPPVNETIFNGEFYVQFNFILTFMLPLITLIICYGAISVKLIKDQMDKPEAFLRRNRHGNHHDRRSRVCHHSQTNIYILILKLMQKDIYHMCFYNIWYYNI